MPVMLFRLRGVPEDEAGEIRHLLTENHVDFYETPPGSWGLSMAAIWLQEESVLPYARHLIEQYQQERSARARSEYELARRAGEAEGMLDRLRQNPVAFLVVACLFGLVVYFSIRPYMAL